MNVKEMNKNKRSSFVLVTILILTALFIGCPMQGAPPAPTPPPPPAPPAPPIQSESATPVGFAYRFGVGVRSATGLVAIAETLYMVGGDGISNNNLYTVDATTGIASQVGSASQFGVDEDARGLAIINDTLYMVGAANDALYTVDITTGIASQVGSASQFGVDEDSHGD